MITRMIATQIGVAQIPAMVIEAHKEHKHVMLICPAVIVRHAMREQDCARFGIDLGRVEVVTPHQFLKMDAIPQDVFIICDELHASGSKMTYKKLQALPNKAWIRRTSTRPVVNDLEVLNLQFEVFHGMTAYGNRGTESQL